MAPLTAEQRSKSAWLKLLVHRDAATTSQYQPGAGTAAPESFNNKGYFALFALLGAAMVIVAIWFFFWAPNGGFVWRKNDWSDYKSTVLRRKDKDGKTLSNATPHTDLGQKSIAGTFDNERREEMAELGSLGGFTEKAGAAREKNAHKPRAHRQHEHVDTDVRAYRHERAARVGGLNREHDGSHFDFTNSERSSHVSSVVSNNSRTHLNPLPPPPKKQGFLERRAAKRDRKRVDKAAAAKKSGQPASGLVKERLERRRDFDDVSTVADQAQQQQHGRQASDSHYANMYRPQAGTGAARPSANGYRRGEDRRRSQQQPSSSGAFRRHDPKPPGSFDAYSDGASSDTGTKSYTHHIPALGRGSRDTGFRRSQPTSSRRRDSLSDSD